MSKIYIYITSSILYLLEIEQTLKNLIPYDLVLDWSVLPSMNEFFNMFLWSPVVKATFNILSPQKNIRYVVGMLAWK